MKSITYATLGTIILAAPVAAHTGAHLRPHGSESLPFGLALIALAGGVALLRAGLRR